MAEPVTIAVDVMGGDRGPAVVLRGALQALEADPDLRLTLVGPAEEVEPFAAAHDRATAQVATEGHRDGGASGRRRARQEGLLHRRGLPSLRRSGAADGFFSAGSTGACRGRRHPRRFGRIKGVKRPALSRSHSGLGPSDPAHRRVGANADRKPEYLVQFAQMGEVYMNVPSWGWNTRRSVF
ncbi:MAG: hypothetical protein ACLTDR_05875 [Adlercreutzia equolifaciens]